MKKIYKQIDMFNVYYLKGLLILAPISVIPLLIFSILTKTYILIEKLLLVLIIMVFLHMIFRVLLAFWKKFTKETKEIYIY